mmetsp:Transcript_76024/g.134626  ORF Transcript_76024/g.134626 Transcript_76024/m.134626 type:complete len:226 (+) Transcript_76024:60-737(+)
MGAVASCSKSGVGIERNILCYGDSNTFGFRGSPPGQRPYGMVLGELLNEMGYPVEVETCGNCGFTAKRLWDQKDEPVVTGSGQTGLTTLLDNGDFDLVIIMLGTNGLNFGQEVPEILEYTEKLHEYVHSKGIKTMAVAGIMPEPEKGGFALKSKYHSLAEGLDEWEDEEDYDGDDCLAFADPEVMVPRTEPGMYDADNMHFSQAGLERLAEVMAPKVAVCLDKMA